MALFCVELCNCMLTHSDIGFAVNSVPRSKRARETQGERVSKNSMVEHCLQVTSKSICTISVVTSSAAGKWVSGKYHVRTMKTNRANWTAWATVDGRYVERASSFDILV